MKVKIAIVLGLLGSLSSLRATEQTCICEKYPILKRMTSNLADQYLAGMPATELIALGNEQAQGLVNTPEIVATEQFQRSLRFAIHTKVLAEATTRFEKGLGTFNQVVLCRKYIPLTENEILAGKSSDICSRKSCLENLNLYSNQLDSLKNIYFNQKKFKQEFSDQVRYLAKLSCQSKGINN